MRSLWRDRSRPITAVEATDDRFTDALGVELGHRWSAIEAVGLYVPGGTAAYPSSVLMNAVPAKVAGVPRVVMVVPAPDGKLSPLVLAAAKLAGVDEIYRIGGAQAVAALAYGTATIKPVAKIVGPGNAYVAAAKRIVFGMVGIDMIAGPSEVLILADKSGNPDWIAADLLAPGRTTRRRSRSMTDDGAGRRCREAVTAQLTTLPRAGVAHRGARRESGAQSRRGYTAGRCTRASIWRSKPPTPSGAAKSAMPARSSSTRTPEAIGDYVAGSNHVLPTALGAVLVKLGCSTS
jgi:histidinol dehydrogenase